VAQAQRQWAQAQQHYQQALAICVEYNDRYSQASTYHQLGMVAQEQQQWAQAREYFLTALSIGVEFKDEYRIGTRLESLARLWRASGDAGLPAAVAAVLGVAPEEVEELLRAAGGRFERGRSGRSGRELRTENRG
jgi:tetratricopeptide (TPR) repeat protein